MILVLALLRLGLEIPSPPELVGDRVGERVPVKPFLSLIGRIGSYARLKALSVFGVILVARGFVQIDTARRPDNHAGMGHRVVPDA